MEKYLFLSAEDRRPAEESDYRYKKSKPVTAVKTKRDEDGFFIPWAMFRPIGEKGLLCELFGANPIRRAADLRMNRDLLMKEAYEHEVELLMCRIRASEIWMQQEFCKEEQAMQRQAWQLVQRGHAVANGLPVITVNRVGHEDDPSGNTIGLDFWGYSFAAGAQGEILAQFDTEHEENKVVDIDMDRTEYVRRGWPFFRDRRIDAYDPILKRFGNR